MRDGPGSPVARRRTRRCPACSRWRALRADAVDVVERLVGERNAVGAADPDPGAGAGGAAALEHLDARRPARDQVGELGDRRELGHRGDVDGRDGVGDLELALLAGGGASRPRRAAPAPASSAKSRSTVLAGRHGGGLHQRPVADAQHPDLVRPRAPRPGSGTRRPGSRSRSGWCRVRMMRAASRPVPVVWSVIRPEMPPFWAAASGGAARTTAAASSGTRRAGNR